MTQSIFRTTLLATAALALSAGSAWAQTASPDAPQADRPAAGTDGSGEASDGGQAVTDTWITAQVKAKLAATEGVKSLDISVETDQGVVVLIGTQPDETAVKKAEAVAQSIKGVKKVDSSALEVKG